MRFFFPVLACFSLLSVNLAVGNSPVETRSSAARGEASANRRDLGTEMRLEDLMDQDVVIPARQIDVRSR